MIKINNIENDAILLKQVNVLMNDKIKNTTPKPNLRYNYLISTPEIFIIAILK